MPDEHVTPEDLAALRSQLGRIVAGIDTLTERQDDSDRLSKRANINSTLALAAVVLVVLLGVSFAKSNTDRIDDNTKARIEGRAAVCSGFEAFGNAFISIAQPAATEEARARAQARIDAFEASAEKGTAALGCDFHFIPAAGPTTTAPPP